MPESPESHVDRRNVSMYQDDWSIVRQVEEQLGENNTSLALRHIVRDWLRVTGGWLTGGWSTDAKEAPNGPPDGRN